MPFSEPFLKRMAVAEAIAHPADDLTKVSGQVRNMTVRNEFLFPEAHPTDKKGAMVYRPGDCVTAAVVLRLWNAGFSSSDVFDAAVSRLNLWHITDEHPEWQEGDPEPEDAPHPDKPHSPSCHVLKDFCETSVGWSLRIDHRRNSITGEFRTVASLWRGDEALGNGATDLPHEVPQSSHVIVLDEILAQVAASTIYRKKAH